VLDTARTFRVIDRGWLLICDCRTTTAQFIKGHAFRFANLGCLASPYGLHITTRFTLSHLSTWMLSFCSHVLYKNVGSEPVQYPPRAKLLIVFLKVIVGWL
jgi:hypothetical protein